MAGERKEAENIDYSFRSMLVKKKNNFERSQGRFPLSFFKPEKNQLREREKKLYVLGNWESLEEKMEEVKINWIKGKDGYISRVQEVDNKRSEKYGKVTHLLCEVRRDIEKKVQIAER